MTGMTRAERRRAERMKAGEGLAVAPDALTAPNHWHVDTVAYSHDVNGVHQNEVHLHGLVTNDLVLCETYVLGCVKPLSGATRANVAIEQATMCAEPTHLEKAEEALLDREEPE